MLNAPKYSLIFALVFKFLTKEHLLSYRGFEETYTIVHRKKNFVMVFNICHVELMVIVFSFMVSLVEIMIFN